MVDNGLAGAVSRNGNHVHRQITEIAALQNAVNNNIFSVVNATAAQSQSSDSTTAAVGVHCSTSIGSSPGSSASSTSSSSKLPVKCDRYKTELCRTYEENGTCRYGDKCQFAHGAAEMRTVARHPKYKTDLCRTFHTTGFCPYGSRCHFIHSLHERQLPVQPSRLQIQAANLLLPQLAVKSTQLSSPQMNSHMVRERQSLDNLIHTLSSLLRTNQVGAGHIATGLLAQEQSRKLAAHQTAAEFPLCGASPQRMSYISDTTSVSTDSASPCPSPTSLIGIHDDPLTPLSYFAVKSNAHIPRSTGFQSPATIPAGILTPPSSPGSAASSLNSLSSDYDGCDWSRSVWPTELSPVKGVDVSLLPDFAHCQLLTAKNSFVFA